MASLVVKVWRALIVETPISRVVMEASHGTIIVTIVAEAAGSVTVIIMMDCFAHGPGWSSPMSGVGVGTWAANTPDGHSTQADDVSVGRCISQSACGAGAASMMLDIRPTRTATAEVAFIFNFDCYAVNRRKRVICVAKGEEGSEP